MKAGRFHGPAWPPLEHFFMHEYLCELLQQTVVVVVVALEQGYVLTNLIIERSQ